MILALLLTVAPCFQDSRFRAPDRVVLTDGTELEGRVLYDDGQDLVFRVKTRTRTLFLG